MIAEKSGKCASRGQWELQSLFKAAKNTDNIVMEHQAHTESKFYYLQIVQR